MTREDYMEDRLADILFLCEETMPVTIEEYERILQRIRSFASAALRWGDLVEANTKAVCG